MKRNLFKLIFFTLFLLSLFQQVMAQNRSFTARVTNDKGEPLVDVTVTVNKSKTSALTNSEGIFIIQASTTDELTISSVAYDAVSVRVGSKNNLSISMATKTNTMNEVVVV